MKPRIFDETVFAWLGPMPLTNTMLTTTLVSLVLLWLGALVGRAVEHHPSGQLAALGRLGSRALRSLVEQAAGKPWPVLETFAGTLFSFIAASAVIGQLPGVVAPTAQLATTCALAVLVFLAVPVAGIQRQGLAGYLKHYFVPTPLLFPFHVISELSRTVALALRLFGNMLSGHLVVALIVALVGLFVPVPLMALDLLIGLLQAYIFTVLACVYVGAALRVGEGA
jgi:F-type H+-transporting ATPase subunit a